MNMIAVSSSAIAAIGYEGGTLYVTFHTGRTYPHPSVPYEIFLCLFHAESKGTYYNQHIRGHYR
jgi:hypothetical protein